MNKYIKHKIQNFADIYSSNLFDQYDVESFFVAARDYSENSTFIREIGDFIAHPKMKTIGTIRDNLVGVAIPSLDRFIDKYKRGSIDITKIPSVELLCDNKTISKELEQIFKIADIDKNINESDDSFRDFMFCTILLLGNFSVKVKTKHNGVTKENIYPLEAHYSNHVTLEINFESNKFKRKGGIISILEVPNVWPACPRVIVPQKEHLNGYIARRFKEGFLAAVEFKHDKSKTPLTQENMVGSTFWPSKTKSIL